MESVANLNSSLRPSFSYKLNQKNTSSTEKYLCQILILLTEVTNFHVLALGNLIHFRIVVVDQLLCLVFDIGHISVQVFDFIFALEAPLSNFSSRRH